MTGVTGRRAQAAATRAALLEAGRRIFARDGYHRASLDRIAAEAGFTKGAVYASFATKADLLLAIYEERTAERAALVARAAEDAEDLEALRRRLLEDWHHGLERERGWSILRIEFWAHAARDEALRRRLREAHLPMRDAIARALATMAERTGETLPCGADAFATLVMALGNGLNLEAFLDEADTEGLYDLGTRQLGATPAKEER